MSPYWYRLIFYWTNVLKKDGLTVPYVIGASKLADSQVSISPNQINLLFTDIVNFPSVDTIVTLSYCDTIGEKVLGLVNRIQEKYYRGKGFINPATGKVSLMVGNGLNIGISLEDICQSLNDEYKLAIKDGNFSLKYSEWQPFTAKDEEMINNALNYTKI